ncbi:unnamed protein product [Phaedon cochleariae]|uniref:Phosphodiesterase n=1 Tax=Phaedon cochleariae TaxID=80249 RepID=A0A9P0DUI7_PHACE|nr:unnamed protein product [Phaedon cochleariae]
MAMAWPRIPALYSRKQHCMPFSSFAIACHPPSAADPTKPCAGAGAGAVACCHEEGDGGGRRGGSGGRCGLCSMVARAFRRVVCGGAGSSRRSSGEAYQELTAPAQDEENGLAREHGISIDVGGENVTYIPIGTPAEVSPFQQSFSKEDWILLDAMGPGPSLSATGKFLTMHKRRRKKLTTRSLLQDHAILDDIHHGQVQKILDRCGKWAFNAFTLETVAGGRSLPVLCVHLFHWYGLLDYFQLDVVRVWKLFALIEEGYHSTNPYHNSIHATDVTQAMHCFLQEDKIRQHVTPLEIMASLIGAVAHDLDHPGVNQHFLISTSNHLAILYQNKSVLENHHWRSAIGCLLESGLAEQLRPYRTELEQQIRELILATDINRQPEFLTRFKRHLDEDSLDLRMSEHRLFIMQIALKCADISNPTRPWDISRKWSLKVCDEFFRQGEFERQLNLPVTSICDRQSTSVARIQVGFFKIVVTPLFTEWHRFMHSRLSTRMMRTLEENQRRWRELEAAELEGETSVEASVAVSDDDDGSPKRSSGTPSVHDFIPPPTREIRRQSLAVPTPESLGVRRHSVPAHTDTPPPLPRTIHRRESLPTGRGAGLGAGRSPVSPQAVSRASSGLREEEEELLGWGSPGSEGSDGSPLHSSEGRRPDRPLSAETLLPEPSIASMTSSSESAGRLTSVLQGLPAPAPCKGLTRQQTFPPPQPYNRMRYMSATAEMSACHETPYEEDSRSTSSHGSPEHISTTSNGAPQYTIPSIAVLSPNDGRPLDAIVQDLPPPRPAAPQRPAPANHKRETEAADGKEKTCKMVKLSEPEQRQQKENVDPRRSATTSLARRRGSAPVTLPLSKPDENKPPAGGGLMPSDTHSLRRGSVPIEIAHYQPYDYDDDLMRQPLITPVETSRSFWQCQRRGSAPLALPPLAGHALTRHTSLNGKAGGRRNKQLRRRSSGGPETVMCVAESRSDVISRLLMHHHHQQQQQQRASAENADALLVRRRGSLPIEVLTVGHSVF